MRHIRIAFVVTLATLALALSFYARTQKQRSTQTAQTNSNIATSTQPSKIKGRLLVQKLPGGVEGVTLDKKTAALKLKSGYEFVKQESGSIGVAPRMASGGLGNIVFTGECQCLPPPKGQTSSGKCTAHISNESVTCEKGSCTGECKLSITIGGISTGLIIY